MREILRLFGIGNINDRGTVEFFLPRQGVHLFAAMMSDVGNPPVTLLVNRRLIRAARLQVVVADKIHVALFSLLLPQRDGA